jgi:hypothetical protein
MHLKTLENPSASSTEVSAIREAKTRWKARNKIKVHLSSMKSQNIKTPTTANIDQLMVRPVENAAKRATLNPFARQARK